MSGGSYDYLCFKDEGQLLSGSHDEHMMRMTERLIELGYKDAAQKTAEALQIIIKVRLELIPRISEMMQIWKSVEWLDSKDCGQDTVAEAVEKWRSKK